MNATVTLSIGELDALRDELKQAKEKLTFLEKTQKQVKLVVSEKKIQRISNGDSWEIQNFYPGERHRPSYYRDEYRLVEQKPEYINFEDVNAVLKNEAETKVAERIGLLEREIISLKERVEAEKTKYTQIVSDLDLKKQKELKAYLDEATKVENDLKQQISILKGELVDLNKDDEIKALKEKLAALESESVTHQSNKKSSFFSFLKFW